MAAIRGKDTCPEIIVRRYLHSQGFRFRLHMAGLPGKPDLVLPRYNSVIFVHGCFWHVHDCQFGAVKPKTNAEFWAAKRQRNVERDGETVVALEQLGWRVKVLWECDIETRAFTASICEWIKAGQPAAKRRR